MSGRDANQLTVGQIVAISHVHWHSLAKPIAECRRCRRLRKRLEKRNA